MRCCAPALALLWAAAGAAGAAKIVAVPPILFESHLYIFQRLAAALQARGHRTVLLLAEGRALAPSPHYALQRYPGVFNGSAADAFLQDKVRRVLAGALTALELLDVLDRYARNCALVVGNGRLLRALRRQRFDLLLVDPNDMCGFVLAHLLRVRYAVLSTGLWFPAEVGAPAPLAYVPEFNSQLTDRMGLRQRLHNALVYLLSRAGVSLLVLPKYDRILRARRPRAAASMRGLVQRASLWMLCTDVALEFPRPSLPNVVYVGGILTRPARPLPPELQAWVSDAGEHGFVLVSFGAGVKYLSEDIAAKLAGALARLPQKVIWRFSGPKPKNLGNNTKLMEWLPQNDLLGHSRVRAFLSHGGLNSIFETMYHGVPVVGVPLFGDHYDTMTRVQAKGMGISLEWSSVTEAELHAALVKVINDPSYRRRARKLSEIHRDQRGHPVLRAVYWIEYVLRHRGAPHLRAAVHRLSFCQYFLLDAACVLLLGAAALGLLLSRAAGLLSRHARGWWARCARRAPRGPHPNGVLNGLYARGSPATREKKGK